MVTESERGTSLSTVDPLLLYLTEPMLYFSATILSCGWIIYLTYYNSRNIGLILTLIINRLYKDGYIHIGELHMVKNSEAECCQSFQSP